MTKNEIEFLADLQEMNPEDRKRFVDRFNAPIVLNATQWVTGPIIPAQAHSWAAWRIFEGEIHVIKTASSESEARDFYKGINRFPENHERGSTAHFGTISLYPSNE